MSTLLYNKLKAPNSAASITLIILLISLCLPSIGYSQQDVNTLIEKLKDKDSEVRRQAADALAKIGTPAVEPLIAALKDESWDVQLIAANALGKIKAPVQLNL